MYGNKIGYPGSFLICYDRIGTLVHIILIWKCCRLRIICKIYGIIRKLHNISLYMIPKCINVILCSLYHNERITFISYKLSFVKQKCILGIKKQYT